MKTTFLFLIFGLLIILNGCQSTINSETDSGKVAPHEDIISTVLEECPKFEINNQRNSKFEPSLDFCKNINNYNLQKITFTPVSKVHDKDLFAFSSGNQYDLNQWYPSLKEGWIGSAPFYVNNEGCTKVYTFNFRFSQYLCYNGKLIFKQENTNKYMNWLHGLENYTIYPQSIESTNRGIIYDNADDFFRIFNEGEYTYKVRIFYDNNEIGAIEDKFIVQ